MCIERIWGPRYMEIRVCVALIWVIFWCLGSNIYGSKGIPQYNIQKYIPLCILCFGVMYVLAYSCVPGLNARLNFPLIHIGMDFFKDAPFFIIQPTSQKRLFLSRAFPSKNKKKCFRVEKSACGSCLGRNRAKPYNGPNMDPDLWIFVIFAQLSEIHTSNTSTRWKVCSQTCYTVSYHTIAASEEQVVSEISTKKSTKNPKQRSQTCSFWAFPFQ